MKAIPIILLLSLVGALPIAIGLARSSHTDGANKLPGDSAAYKSDPPARGRLYYYGYRFLDDSTSRWMTRDPIGELGGLNLHAHVGNNPLNDFDPLGLYAVGSIDYPDFGRSGPPPDPADQGLIDLCRELTNPNRGPYGMTWPSSGPPRGPGDWDPQPHVPPMGPTPFRGKDFADLVMGGGVGGVGDMGGAPGYGPPPLPGVPGWGNPPGGWPGGSIPGAPGGPPPGTRPR